MKPVIITLSGYKGVGKTTFAFKLRGFLLWANKKQLPLNIKTLALADTLKEEVSKAFGFSLKEIEVLKREENKKVLNDMNMRELLIDFGQKRKEEFGKDFWCNTALDKVLNDVSDDEICVWIVPDVRFPEEQEFFKKTDTAMLYSIWLERLGFSLQESELDYAEKWYDKMSFDKTVLLKEELDLYEDLVELTIRLKDTIKQYYITEIH